MRLLPRYLFTASLITRAFSQTPQGTHPSTNKTLPVTYVSTQVTPGVELPLTCKFLASLLYSIDILTFLTVAKNFPAITYPSSTNQTYQLLMLDLSISTATLNTSKLVPGIQLPLAAGISVGRTTRLHYWQTGLTFSPNGTLVNTTSPIAFYQPPAPPAGDIAHTYVFYLFEQKDGFAPPPAGNPFSAALVNVGSNRMSFDLNHLAGEKGIGPLVGANYFVAQNRTGTAQATGSGTGSVSSPTAISFLGGAGRSTLGFAGAVVTAFTIVLAFPWAT